MHDKNILLQVRKEKKKINTENTENHRGKRHKFPSSLNLINNDMELSPDDINRRGLN
jgi:hypothetical protein